MEVNMMEIKCFGQPGNPHDGIVCVILSAEKVELPGGKPGSKVEWRCPTCNEGGDATVRLLETAS
jgi:hypothetical protein